MRQCLRVFTLLPDLVMQEMIARGYNKCELEISDVD
jgi:hypothetical protein